MIGSKSRAFGDFELFEFHQGEFFFRVRKKLALVVPMFVAIMFLLVAGVNAKGLTRGAWALVAVVLLVSLYSIFKVILDNRSIVIDLKKKTIFLKGRWGRRAPKKYLLPGKVCPVFPEDSDGGIDRSARTVLISVDRFEFVVGKIHMLPKYATQADYVKFLQAQSQGLLI